MRKMTVIKLISIVLMLFFLQACGANQQTAGDEKNNEQGKKTQPYTVTDDTGTEFTFEKAPEMVVSLSPSVTEILFALGVDDKIVGVTNYDNYPEEVKEIEAVSDLVDINVERIIALNPDIVFIYLMRDESKLEAIKEAGIKVFAISDTFSFEEVYEDMRKIAKVMNVEESGEQLISKVKNEVKEIGEKLAGVKEKKRVYLEISPAPSLFTTGGSTFQNEILNTAGVENIFADINDWFAPSEEEIIRRNPEVIITTVKYTNDPVGEIKSRRGWGEIEAVKNNQVYQFDPDLMSRPGPRIAQAVEHTAKTIYPELFE